MPSVYIVKPLNENCTQWLMDNVSDNAQWFAGGIAAEHRYLEDLITGMIADGFVIEVDFTIIS